MSIDSNPFSMFNQTTDSSGSKALRGSWGTVGSVSGKMLIVNECGTTNRVLNLAGAVAGDTVFIVRSKDIAGVAIGKM